MTTATEPGRAGTATGPARAGTAGTPPTGTAPTGAARYACSSRSGAPISTRGTVRRRSSTRCGLLPQRAPGSPCSPTRTARCAPTGARARVSPRRPPQPRRRLPAAGPRFVDLTAAYSPRLRAAALAAAADLGRPRRGDLRDAARPALRDRRRGARCDGSARTSRHVDRPRDDRRARGRPRGARSVGVTVVEARSSRSTPTGRRRSRGAATGSRPGAAAVRAVARPGRRAGSGTAKLGADYGPPSQDPSREESERWPTSVSAPPGGSGWRPGASTSSTSPTARAGPAICSGPGARRTSPCWASATATSCSASASLLAGVFAASSARRVVPVRRVRGALGQAASAPTMVLSRAAFGVGGNALPVGRVVRAARRLGDRRWSRSSTQGRRDRLRPLGAAHGTPRRSIAFLVVVAVIVPPASRASTRSCGCRPG